jgi:DNA-binding response OmpR family regulator
MWNTDYLTEPGPAVITCGRIELDIQGYACLVDGQEVDLTYTEFIFLKTLVQHASRTVRRAALLEAARRGTPRENAPVYSRIVDIHIFRLRRKLRQLGYDCIVSTRSVGYRFIP